MTDHVTDHLTDIIREAMDNVHDMDVTLDDYAAAAELTRNQARDAIVAAGLTQPDDDQIELLRGHVARRLIEFNGIRGTYRVHKVRKRSIRVKSYYFDDREGITFNNDGFVGFAGWADDTNVQPILRAALDWISAEADKRVRLEREMGWEA